MSQQTPPLHDELGRVLKDHVSYEVVRLVAQYELLRAPGKYRSALGKDDAENVEDALIVSFCSHARNILEFFWRTDPKDWGYALAINYAKPGYAPLELTGRVEELYRQLCRQVNHLTYKRTDESSEKIGVKERDELVGIVHDEVERLLKQLKFGLNARYFAFDLLAEAKRKSLAVRAGQVSATNDVKFDTMSIQQAATTTSPKMYAVKIPAGPTAPAKPPGIENKPADDEDAYDPDEIVTLYGHGPMTLKTAVTRVMALPPQERATATIFREGEPPILDATQIEAVARLPGFENSN